MYKLDNDFLVNVGLGGLPVEEKNRLLHMIYERLEMNVGMRLAEKMSDQQLSEFESFIDQNNEAGALKWLESNFPNYKHVVAEELEKLRGEVQAAAPQIIAAAQQAGQQMPAVAQEPMMPGMPPQQPVGAPAPAPQPAYQQPQPSYQQQMPPQLPQYGPQPYNPGMQPAAAPAPMPQQPTYGPAPMPPQQPQPAFTPPAAPQQPSYQPQPGFAPPAAAPLPQQPQDAPQQDSQQFTPPPPGFSAQ